MYDVVLLSVGEPARVPVLGCVDALTAAGARAETIVTQSDAQIDEVLARLDGPARADGLNWPDPDAKTRLVVAAAADGQVRAVVRRLVRRYAPPPSKRPDAELPAARTMPDLPPIGILPLDATGLASRLGLPTTPADVAAAVLGGRARRLDLLRTDAGSVTLDGAIFGGADDTDRALPWRGRVEVDGKLLSAGDDQLLACVIANAAGYATPEGLPMVIDPDPADGLVEAAVVVPVAGRSRWLRRRLRLEVRRARGRAVSVNPRDGEVRFLDDGVSGTLGRKRSWWIEPGAWAVYTS